MDSYARCAGKFVIGVNSRALSTPASRATTNVSSPVRRRPHAADLHNVGKFCVIRRHGQGLVRFQNKHIAQRYGMGDVVAGTVESIRVIGYGHGCDTVGRAPPGQHLKVGGTPRLQSAAPVARTTGVLWSSRSTA